MAQVFLYNHKAELDEKDIDALREAGFIPVRVKSFEDVKVIDPFVAGERSVVWQAAVEAIHKANSNEGPRTLFGKLLAEKLANTTIP